jgi:hypothetical protein
MDCIYLRLPEEEPYARRLSALLRQATRGPTGDVALNLVCFDRPLLPPRCPQLFRWTWDPIREFHTTGHLRASGDDFARDSAYALFRASGVAGLGDTGRLIREYWREMQDRVAMFLCPGHRSNSSNYRPRHAGPCIRPCQTGGPRWR